jgi:hypothetical protein
LPSATVGTTADPANTTARDRTAPTAATAAACLDEKRRAALDGAIPTAAPAIARIRTSETLAADKDCQRLA